MQSCSNSIIPNCDIRITYSMFHRPGASI
uniref:Uncharacterized protein n=1 Tax=Rhizophora mucronata TaxID=61149 RepID=A0A2P2NMY7_RHIMU